MEAQWQNELMEANDRAMASLEEKYGSFMRRMRKYYGVVSRFSNYDRGEYMPIVVLYFPDTKNGGWSGNTLVDKGTVVRSFESIYALLLVYYHGNKNSALQLRRRGIGLTIYQAQIDDFHRFDPLGGHDPIGEKVLFFVKRIQEELRKRFGKRFG